MTASLDFARAASRIGRLPEGRIFLACLCAGMQEPFEAEARDEEHAETIARAYRGEGFRATPTPQRYGPTLFWRVLVRWEAE